MAAFQGASSLGLFLFFSSVLLPSGVSPFSLLPLLLPLPLAPPPPWRPPAPASPPPVRASVLSVMSCYWDWFRFGTAFLLEMQPSASALGWFCSSFTVALFGRFHEVEFRCCGFSFSSGLASVVCWVVSHFRSDGHVPFFHITLHTHEYYFYSS